MLLIPIGDENYSNKVPFVNYTLIGLNLAVFFLFEIGRPMDIVLKYACNPADPSLVTSISSMFLHAGLWHLIINMLFLFIFGDNVERKIGHIGYLFFYLFTGLAADGLYIMTAGAEGKPSIGASGAIFGVLGAYIFFFHKNKTRLFYMLFRRIGTFKAPAWVTIGYFAAWDFLTVFLYREGEMRVAHWAHIGGFLTGFVIAVLLWACRVVKPGEYPEGEKPDVDLDWDEGSNLGDLINPDVHTGASGWEAARRARQAARPRAKLPSPKRTARELSRMLKSDDTIKLFEEYREARQWLSMGKLPEILEKGIAQRALAEARFPVAALMFDEIVGYFGDSTDLAYYHSMLGIIHADHLDNFAAAYYHLNKSRDIETNAVRKEKAENYLKKLDDFFAKPIIAKSSDDRYSLIVLGGVEPSPGARQLVSKWVNEKRKGGKRRPSRGNGLLADGVSRKDAESLIREMKKTGDPVVGVPTEALVRFPKPGTWPYAEAIPRGLRLRRGREDVGTIGWKSVLVVNAVRMERHHSIADELRARGKPSHGRIVDVVTANPLRCFRFVEHEFTPGLGFRQGDPTFEEFLLRLIACRGAGIYGPDVMASSFGAEWRFPVQNDYRKFEQQTRFLLQRALVRRIRLKRR
ncbi:MAG: rhomboid family intramembrane serine protease [Planctomycetota bacterium]|nr:MAG: rhomboid family intramembrane serine protease [Planctomycetota bacterium]